MTLVSGFSLASGDPAGVRDIVRRAQRGFTLIELMIVVVIIGVLGALAVYSVTNYIDHAKTGEAREMVGNIMAGQEAYFDEVGAYLDVTGGLDADDFYPLTDFNGDIKVQWGGDTGCGEDCKDNFLKIGVMAPQPVMFRYASTVYAAGAGPDFGGWADDCEGAMDTKAGYVVVAVSDLDPGGPRSVVVGSRMQPDQCAVNLGE